MIRIEQGSIFDSKCDLLVVPCNTGGGVTGLVRSNLESRGLPSYVGSIPLGGVHFREVRYENAATLAFAASVDLDRNTATPEAVSTIARELRAYCSQNNQLAVNVPLLGTGAGGLTPGASYSAMRQALGGDDRVTYTIYCFTREAYQNVSASVGHEMPKAEVTRPRVFISYAGNDRENAAWVRGLATRLREEGVDARIDVFHLKPGFDLPQWMTNEVILAGKVILVCDQHYVEKANDRGGGVGWETMIIQGDMLLQGDNKQKYVAIVREDRVEDALPVYVRSKFALKWGKDGPTDEQLRELVMLLYDCDVEPALGPIPAYVKQNKAKSL